MTRLLLADDHTILRDGIRALLSAEADLDVVGEASNGAEILEILENTPADVVLMDVQMPVLDGFATMPELRQRFPDVRVLVLTMLDNENYVARMLEAGALGYVLKNAAITEITYAIRTGSSPCRTASLMSAAVFRVRVLSMMFWRWVSMVRLLANKRSAISALVRPSATRPSTSISRLLRPNAARATSPEGASPVYSRVSSANPMGEHRKGRPATTVCKPCSRSWGKAFLSR